MRLSISLACLLSLTSAAPAAEMSVWVVLPDETVLSTHMPCISEQRCVAMLKDWGFVVASGFDGIYTSLHTSPDGVKIGRWMEYDPDKPYKKQHLFYSRDAMGGPESFYLGTLYVQIR